MNKTQYEAWNRKKPYVSHLKVFCYIAYALINSQSRHKFDKKTTKCIFVAYSSQSKAYRLYNPLSGKIVASKNVVFSEKAEWDLRGTQKRYQILIL